MSEKNTTIGCPDCDGRGELLFPFKGISMPCERCSSSGSVPSIQLEWMKKGTFFKVSRLERKELLRDAANRMGVDVRKLSEAERGCIDPDEFFKKPPVCKHSNVFKNKWGERACRDCAKILDGWFCPDNASTHKCEYSVSDDYCDHCGHPEERK